MSTPKTVDQTSLHAFVDGELDETARAEVEAWLAGHPEDAARVGAYRGQNAGLHGLFDAVLDEPVPERLRHAAIARPARAPWPAWARIAAAVVLLFAGGLSGWGLRDFQAGNDGVAKSFVEHAVGAHLVYASEVRHPVEVAADEEAHLVAWLSKRLGQPLRAPSLLAAGYRLVGGRLLPEDGRPAAQLMYENTAGNRLTVYVRAGRKGSDTAFRFVSEHGVSAFYWIDLPFSCALVGPVPREDLLPIARAVYEQLDKEPW